jgi:hypothetical protein
VTKLHKLIGWCEILGGAVGLTMLAIVEHGRSLPGGALFYFGCVLAFGLSFAAGLLLVRGRLAGARLSAFMQALQVIQLSTTSFHFKFVSGPQLLLVLSGSGIELFPGFYAGFWIGPPVEKIFFWLGINVFSVAALWYLLARPISVGTPGLKPLPNGQVVSAEAHSDHSTSD